jgi:hypothetical protein
MLYRVKSTELALMQPASKSQAVKELLACSRSANGSASIYLSGQVRQFEMRYEMTSAELKRRLQAQPELETADFAQWLFLLDLLEKHEREARAEQA